jgi:hypothetical protein
LETTTRAGARLIRRLIARLPLFGGEIMAIIDLLNALANSVRIILPPGHPNAKLGTPVPFGLTPLPANLETVQAGDVKAIWFTKDVRFADALGAGTTDLSAYLTASSRIFGGQPVVPPDLPSENLPLPAAAGFKLPLPTLTKPDALPTKIPEKDDFMAGTPGVLGQLSGAVPIPIEAPITVSATWRVMTLDDNGRWVDATEGKDFVAPAGLKDPALNLVFLATRAQDLLTLGRPNPQPFEVSVDIVVKALDQSTDPVTIPPQPPNAERRFGIPLDVPAILGIPRLVALFRHPYYQSAYRGEPGAVVIGVPENALIKNVYDLAPVLDTLRDTLKRLQSFRLSPSFTLFLLGLDTLLGGLDTQPKFQFHMGKHEDFHDIKFSEHGWRVFPPQLPGGEDFEDQTSSVIVIGVEGKGVWLFGDDNHPDPPTPGGEHPFWLKLTSGFAMWAAIPNFAGIKTQAQAEAALVPLGSKVEVKPTSVPIVDINNAISSIDYL